MNDIFLNNLSALSERHPHIAEKLKKVPLPEGIEIIDTKTGYKTVKIKSFSNQSILLHSIYDPIKEAENIVNRYLTDNYDVIILGGFGLGFIAQVILKKAICNTLIVIEKDLKIFKTALMLNDLSDTISHPNIFFLFEENEEIEGLTDILLNIATKKVYTLIHPASIKIYPEFYLNLKNIIDSYLSRKNINISTLVRFQYLWIRNLFKNYKFFIENKGIKHFFDLYKNIPALIISAGPSLSDEIKTIRENQNKFLIISVDSCFQILLKYDIIPDFVVTVDPQYINYKYFEYLKEFSPILIAEPSTFFLILKNYKGRIIFFSSVFPFAKWLEKFTESKGEIDMGGSVSTTAFDFAYKIGSNPLILVGQDLSFIKDRTHTKGAYVEKYWLQRYSKFNTIYNGIYKYIHNNLFIKIKSNSDQLINTDKRLLVFHGWFENKIKKIQKERIIYNTSLYGARIKGTNVLTLQEIIKKHNFPDLSNIKNELKKFNDKLTEKQIKENYDSLKKELAFVNEKITELLNLSEKAVYISKKLYSAVKNNEYKKINNFLSELEKIDDNIKGYSDLTEYISLIIQDVIHSILEGYEDYLTEQEKRSKELAIAKRNLILYEGIKNSLMIFQKLLELWEEI